MADSDDEYDRKRRDKFRGERSTGGGASGESYRTERRDDRRGVGGGGGRDDWGDRNPFRGGGGGGRPRPDYRDYRGPRDRYGSPGRDLPPTKRMRPDWGDDLRGNPRYGGYDSYLMHAWNEHYAAHSMHGGYGHAPPPHSREPPINNSDTQTQPAMMTLKQFLDTQDDGISDSEVLRKYSEYKLEFKRQQLNEFFVAHKDEEWFKNKYHPVDSVKRKEEQLSFLQKRVDVFTELLDKGQIKNVSVDTSQSVALLRLLNTVVIKLEGGTEDDLKILDEKPRDADDDVVITSVEKNDTISEGPKVVSPQPIRHVVASDEENWDEDDKKSEPKEADAEKPENDEDKKTEKKSLKRKRSNSDSSLSYSADSDEQEDAESVKQENDELIEKSDDQKKIEENGKDTSENTENDDKISEDAEPAEPLEANGTEKVTNNDEVEADKNSVVELETVDVDEDKDTAEIADQPETIDLDKVKDGPQPRALHQTSSIFLRNLAPSITKAEIEAVCQRFDGYLRVAIADPLVERRWYRRGWVTFRRDVNIKEICWSLNNTRLKDCEMGAIVNRDLSRRVRAVDGMTAHKTILRADIKLCAKIAMNLDEKFKLWDQLNKTDEGNNANGNTEHNAGNSASYGFRSNNPVLQNITDFLIEEASAEEEELLGISGENKDGDGEVIERDPQLISVLDSLILYLRIVHSVDFYNHCEYPYEDEMPNRCGIIHARGSPSSKVSQNDLQNYIKNFENKMQTFLTKVTTIDEEELKNLGSKDSEVEVEKFIQANTQEISKDKWLCPLSGKKFKGPEFIRKHIFNKHLEKVDEVRKEVEFFNNYLKDSKRPQLPEHPGTNKRTNSESGGGGYRPPLYPPAYAPPYAAYAPPMMMPGGRGGRGFGGGGGGGRRELPLEHQRRIIGYHDLDAPANFDMFD